MRTITVTFTLEVSDDATDNDIDNMLTDAGVQFQEPADEDGERAVFTTANVQSTWAFNPDTPA